MTTISGHFTATGVGTSIELFATGGSVDYVIRGTFVGTAYLVRQVGDDWAVVAGPFTAASSGTHVSTYPRDVIAVRCTAYTSGALSWQLTSTEGQAVTEQREIAVPLVNVRQAAAAKDALPDSPNATTLGLGDAAAAVITATTTNGGGTASASETCMFDFVLPPNYISGAAITLRVRAKTTALSGVANTLDAVVKAYTADGALGSDICATTIKTLTTSYADYDFTITGDGLSAGDKLNTVLTLASEDDGTQDAVQTIGDIRMLPMMSFG